VRIKLIACEVVFREICLCAARARSVIDLVFLRRGLHSNPDTLREDVQAQISASEDGQCDAVALAYGLCSNGIAGLRAHRVPRSPEDGAGLDASFDELVAKYGRDNAEYLWEYQSQWVKHYSQATHVYMQLGSEEAYRDYVKRIAEEHGSCYVAKLPSFAGVHSPASKGRRSLRRVAMELRRASRRPVAAPGSLRRRLGQ